MSLSILNTPKTALNLEQAKRQFQIFRASVVLKEIRFGKCLCVSQSNPERGEHWWIDVGFDEGTALDPSPDTARRGHTQHWNYHKGIYENRINDLLTVAAVEGLAGAALAFV